MSLQSILKIKFDYSVIDYLPTLSSENPQKHVQDTIFSERFFHGKRRTEKTFFFFLPSIEP